MKKLFPYAVITITALALFVSATPGHAGSPASEPTLPAERALKKQPIELGNVAWYRDYSEATAASRKTSKPMLVLFQEVPG